MIDILETEPGVYSILLEGESFEAYISGDQIVIDGHTFPLELDDPREWKRARAGAAAQGRAALTAPMPGKVIRLLVAEGDDVEAGQGLVVVEAMKMQNELKSPRAGRVTAIKVKENDGVNAGALLVVVE